MTNGKQLAGGMLVVALLSVGLTLATGAVQDRLGMQDRTADSAARLNAVEGRVDRVEHTLEKMLTKELFAQFKEQNETSLADLKQLVRDLARELRQRTTAVQGFIQKVHPSPPYGGEGRN